MMSIEDQARARVIAEALTWEGTPYHHAARIKGVGVDCAMLLAEVYERAGVIPHVAPESYPPDWHQHHDRDRFMEEIRRFAVETNTPKPGDIAMYRFGRASSHGAIVIGWPDIIHSVIGRGVMRDTGDMPQLAARFVGFWTLWPGEDAE